MPSIAALVPMRHHSQRVPGKNYRPLAGRPLYHHILATLMAVPEVTQIAVDTDSDVIMDGLRNHFPAVKVIVRPEHLRADDIPMNDVLAHDISQVDADYYVQSHSTSPLLRPATISASITKFLGSREEYDSLFTVTRLQTRLYDQHGRALNHDPSVLIQTQDLPPVYEENSCLYLFTGENLLRHRHRIGQRPMLFEIDAAESWDIDDELDFQICELLMEQSGSGGGSAS
jgi:CMP-N-acetylneuraminic acid synthetase